MVLPGGFTELRRRRGRAHVLAARDRKLAEGAATLGAGGGSEFSVEGAVRFLTARGLDEPTVREGSIPQESLDYVHTFLRSELGEAGPVLALHIGNFVGVSLAWLTDALRSLSPGSRVFSIDPDITHRAVERPATHVFALLGHFGLLESNVVISGYTLEQGVGDDNALEPARAVEAEQRSEQVLRSLGDLASRRFRLILIDGNHDARYLERELEQVRRLLSPGGLLVLDDVDEATWDLVAAIFDRLAGEGDFEELGRDGRLGILRARPGAGL